MTIRDVGEGRRSSLGKGPGQEKCHIGGPGPPGVNSVHRVTGEVMELQGQGGPRMLASGLGLVLGLLGSHGGSGSRDRMRSALG